MNMTYKQSFKLSIWDKLIFGLIVVAATIIGNLIADEQRSINIESLKSVDAVVNKYEEYALLLDKYQFQLEEIERKKNYLEMLGLFQKLESEEYEKTNKEILSLTSTSESTAKEIHYILRSSDIELGKYLQNHLLHNLSYLITLHSAQNSLREARLKKTEWSIENSTAVIEDMENRLQGMRLSSISVRKFAISQAMP